jgi:hypothetical protein
MIVSKPKLILSKKFKAGELIALFIDEKTGKG